MPGSSTPPKLTFDQLLGLLYAKLKELSPLSEEEQVHLAAVSAWVATGKRELESLKDLSQTEAEAALARYYAKRPKRRAGRPTTYRPHHLKKALTNRLVDLGLQHLPDNPETLVADLAHALAPK